MMNFLTKPLFQLNMIDVMIYIGVVFIVAYAIGAASTYKNRRK